MEKRWRIGMQESGEIELDTVVFGAFNYDFIESRVDLFGYR